MKVQIPYKKNMKFEYGRVAQLANNIRRIVAKNPSPFTFYGTGTYIIGRGSVAVIDPGPADDTHIGVIAATLAANNESISHILVTHTHNDHSPGVPLLQKLMPAPSYGYGRHGVGKSAAGVLIEEGGDLNFVPDVYVKHNDMLQGEGWTIQCVHTPGHTSNHMCYRLVEEQALFTGDHIMGWSTSVIAPPDGDMSQYMNSLTLLLDADDKVFWPTHGPAIYDTKAFVQAFIAHRREREEQVIGQLQEGRTYIKDMIVAMYPELPVQMHRAAAQSVFATMLYLVEKSLVLCATKPALDAPYQLTENRC